MSPGTGPAPGQRRARRSAADLLPWPALRRLALAALPPGPRASAAARARTAELLRRGSQEALPWAARVTGMPGIDSDGRRRGPAEVETRVIDRAALVTVSAARLRALLSQVPVPGASSRGALPVALATPQLAGLLALSAARTLGQVLPPRRAGEPITLALVAPNVLALQERLDLDRLDLPRWVALHEAAHALQLRAAPWMPEYLAEHARGALASALGPDAPPALGPAMSSLLGARRAPSVEPAQVAGLDLLLGAAGRAHLAALLTAVTVMEGHAQWVLDAVEPAELASVHVLRSRLGADAAHPPGRTLLGRLAGLKDDQYVQGAAFARAVAADAGARGLQRLWDSPAALPTSAELADPSRWIARQGVRAESAAVTDSSRTRQEGS